VTSEPHESPTLAAVRRIILGLVALGTIGMTAELLLIGHYDDANQLIPLALAVAGLIAMAAVSLSPGVATFRAFQFVMLLYAGAGIIGITLHYQANAAHLNETEPGLQGLALVKKAVASAAPPALAPGLMVQLALLGLAYTYKHPRLKGVAADR
jgi:hypothetical protein